MKHAEPYGELASIYDKVMDHVHYDVWARYIVSLLERYGSGIQSLLEIACGTGTMTGMLAGHGYRVTASDRSAAMLAVAGQKLSGNGSISGLVAADMCALPFSHSFDAVLCLYDSMNYLCDPAQVAQAIAEAARLLKQGGLYIFDVCTIRNSQLFFSHHEMSESVGPVTYRRTSRYRSGENIQENEFLIESNGACICELHRQRIYRLGELKSLIDSTEFDIVGLFDDMSLRPGTEQSERVHFVLKRR